VTWQTFCVLSNVGGTEESQLWAVNGGTEKKEPLVMCGNWNVRQAIYVLLL